MFPATPAIGDLTAQRWAVTIERQSFELNAVVGRPAVGTTVKGVVLDMHGNSAAQETLSPTVLGNSIWHMYFVSRGYITVSVARRGNYGSTGERLINVVTTGLQASYSAGTIPYADISLASWRYQAASMVAALANMAGNPAFAPHLHTILLIGTSGGAATAVQTSVDSAVFRQAAQKALIRVTGRDSASDTNPDAGPGEYQYLSRIAAASSPSLWIGGTDDPITAVGNLACEFKFFDESAGFENAMYLIPGFGHGGPEVLLSDRLFPILSGYLAQQGFDLSPSP
jgi:hypothetical protein